MAHLAAFLPQVTIATSSDFGVDVDAKEAIAFAILAYETWRGRPSNLPSATGAQVAPVLLGQCHADAHLVPVVSEFFPAIQTNDVSSISSWRRGSRSMHSSAPGSEEMWCVDVNNQKAC